MTKIKKISVLSLAKTLAFVMACVGFLAGILYSFGGLIIDLLTIGLNKGTALAFMALIGMPVIFASCGLIAGAIAALFYNLYAKWFGGLEIEFDE